MNALIARPTPIALESARSAFLGFALLVTAIFCYLVQAYWILAGDPRPGWFTDSVFYLALADFYASPITGSMPRYAADYYGTSRYPPLFPLSLALGGGGLHNWHAAFLVTLTFGLLALVLTFLWMRQQTSSTFAAGALLPLAILSPQYFFLHLEILSESQFIMLLCTTLLLATSCQTRKTSLTALLAAASMIPLSRTAGIAVLVALAPWILLKVSHLRLRVRLVAYFSIWFPVVAWLLYRRLFPVTGDYSTDLIAALGGNNGSLFQGLAAAASRLVSGYSAWFNLTGGGTAYAIAIFFLATAAIGWWMRVRSLQVDAVLLPIYLVLVAVWPYPAETARLLSVTMPLVALQAFVGVRGILSLSNARIPDAAAAMPVGIAFLVLTALGSGGRWVDIVERSAANLDSNLEREKRTIGYFLVPAGKAPYAAEVTKRFAELAAEMTGEISENDCVWASYYVITGVLTDFKIRLNFTPQDIRSASDARSSLASCRYLLVVHMTSAQVATGPLYPAEFIPFAKPVMMSFYNEDGEKRLAAALFDLRPADGR